MLHHEESAVRRHWWMKGLAFLVCAPAFLAVMSLIVMWLWNALIPSLFAGPIIGFWQAAGLLLLCRILFGGFRRVGPPGWAHRHHGGWRRRWHRMSPEERERFRESFRRWKDMSHEQRREFKREFREGFRGCGPWMAEPRRPGPDSAEPGVEVK